MSPCGVSVLYSGTVVGRLVSVRKEKVGMWPRGILAVPHTRPNEASGIVRQLTAKFGRNEDLRLPTKRITGP